MGDVDLGTGGVAAGRRLGSANAENENVMPLTGSFKEFVKSRIERDPKFRHALFQEAVQTLIDGDIDTAKAVLRDHINATIGFGDQAGNAGMSWNAGRC